MKRTNKQPLLRPPFNFQLLYGLILLLLTAVPTMPAAAQSHAAVQALQAHREKALQEKLFLHLDRPLYVCGETMWFKVYYTDATLHQPLHLSKVAYVEVLDEAQKPVLQGKIALSEGTGKGSFVLPLTLSSGSYTVRAYTNWMKNFSPDFYFEQQITILNTYIKPGLTTDSEPAYALQLFPEGGNLVEGLQSKVAFKVTEKSTGKGVAATGELLDEAGAVVTTFAPAKAGIGQFMFTPAPGIAYTAVLKVGGKQVLTQKLPRIYSQGYVMQLQDDGSSVIRIKVSVSPQRAEQLYLLGHARQVITVAETGLADRGEITFTVPKKALAEGITHFTVFNSSNQPVSERLYFKRPEQNLAIETRVAKAAFSKREQVELQVSTRSGAGSPVAADLSVAVYRTDESQRAPTSDISTYLWLTSELKGQVEDAASYLSDTTALGTQALDHLMLTHGWSRFRWDDILLKKAPAFTYLPEYNGHLVQGRITHAGTGAAAPGIRAFLASPSRHIRLYNGVSGVNGTIRFELKDFYGPKELVMQTDTRTDSTYTFGILSSFSDQYSSRKLPAFTLDALWHHALTLRHTESEAQQLYFRKFRDNLVPAAIDSIPFYGTPDQKYLLDDYTRFKVMEEVMREYVPGVLVRKRRGNFHFKVMNNVKKTVFQNDPMVLLDGVPVFDIDKLMAFDPLKIQQLDVITNAFFQGPMQYDGVVSYTTYKGDLAGFALDPHALLVEYEGLQLEREFYAPAYATDEQKQSRLPDFRNLLHWAPEVTTRADGKAAITFYTSDSAGTYLVVVQGLTKQGLFGSHTFSFEVKQPL